jgi:hypothetical protein
MYSGGWSRAMIDWGLNQSVMDSDCGRHGGVVDEVDPLVVTKSTRHNATRHASRIYF